MGSGAWMGFIVLKNRWVCGGLMVGVRVGLFGLGV